MKIFNEFYTKEGVKGSKGPKELPCLGALECCPFNTECILTKKSPDETKCPAIITELNQIKSIRRPPKGTDELPCFSKQCPFQVKCNGNKRKCPASIIGQPGESGI